MEPTAARAPRRLVRAEILSIGTEITTGETRDTNAGELARSLTEAGVEVVRMSAVPDRRIAVEAAFREAFDEADLVVSTGGLGPTPDDLTRESVAALWGEIPAVDPDLERWLRRLWDRRGMAFPEMNLKQAWLIPSARALANPHGTAPGWLIERPDGRVAVLLPGPPREMRPMWREAALPILRERGLGIQRAVRTLRLTGIGESIVAERLGEALLRQPNPEVATYARTDAVDVRLSATGRDADGTTPARTGAELLDELEPVVLAAIGGFVWARGETTWAEAIGAELDRLGWRLATRETGTGGSLVSLVGLRPWLAWSEVVGIPTPIVGRTDRRREAREVRAAAGVEVGLSLAARERGHDTAVSIAVATLSGTTARRTVAFIGGEQGRSRAALTAAALLLETLRSASAR
jgi:nicotinamide-nucleotide amidase